jgi:hypothetical protein
VSRDLGTNEHLPATRHGAGTDGVNDRPKGNDVVVDRPEDRGRQDSRRVNCADLGSRSLDALPHGVELVTALQDCADVFHS